jgi:hypothetical protein
MLTRRTLAAVALTGGLTLTGPGLALAQTDGGTLAAPASRTAATSDDARLSYAADSWSYFRGSVVRRDSQHHWFRMHTPAGRYVTMYTTHRTSWYGCDWGDMHYGEHVRVRAYFSTSQHHWVASLVRNWDDWDHHMMG